MKTRYAVRRQVKGGTGMVSLCCAALLFQSCANAQMSPSAHLRPAEKMMWSTYALATPKGLATCVVVNRRDPARPHQTIPVLVTAAHVFASAPQGPFYIVVRTPNGNAAPEITVLEFVPEDKNVTAFFRHPNYDVAALELHIPAELAREVTLPSSLDESAIGRPGDAARAGDDVSVLGFPHIFPGTTGAFPVLRAGRIASYFPGATEDRNRFLINTTAYGGDSGAPVFAASRSGRPRIVGILCERIGKQEGAVPLAVALSATVIRETLALQLKADRFDVQVGAPEALSNDQLARHGGAQLIGPPQPFLERTFKNLPRL